jgi:Tfp pilus assembly protein PilV
VNIPNYSNCKGFLLIELMIALGLLTTIVMSLGQYQMRVLLYKKAAEQLYIATSLCSDVVEEVWANKLKIKSFSKKKDEFMITVTFTQGPGKIFYYLQVQADWQSALGMHQKITLDAVCAT